MILTKTQKTIYNKYNAMGLYGREELIRDCWIEAQKELLEEIEQEWLKLIPCDVIIKRKRKELSKETNKENKK